MKLITYNVNGIRAAIKKGFINWLEEEQPDIICLQEVKASLDEIDQQPFLKMGYQCHWHQAEKKGYSGVAIFSKITPVLVTYGMGIPAYDVEGRLITFYLPEFCLLNVYMPSGTTGEIRQQFKYQWLESFSRYLDEISQKQPYLLIGGDFNIAHREIDIHNPVANKNSSGFLPQERAWLDKLFNHGFVDLFRVFHKEPHRYTWWNQRVNARARNLGWRIDYWIASNLLQSKVTNCNILEHIVHSDHCPVMVEISK
ncbi:MAG: exodeoxyribonuclease III [Cytophagales bacterium]|nr:exodeoxyribonuclease III [Bernardetiaceae bacterium]MDW8209997.1 exodeoxyribonuclease III [Cytophagales bacterium]